MQNRVKIGMFGYGCVGQGLHDVLLNSRGFRTDIKKICVKDRNKSRRIGSDHFTFEKEVILDDPEINLVVELISDADEAYSIVKESLMNGKNVVSANKKMLAQHLPEMIELQKNTRHLCYTKHHAVAVSLLSVTSKNTMTMKCCYQ